MTAVVMAAGGVAGGVIASSQGLFWTVFAAVGAAIVAFLALVGVVFLVVAIVTPARQRDEVRTEYDRHLRPRMVPLSERRRRLTECLDEGNVILDRARSFASGPGSESEMDQLWEEANQWEAISATTVTQIVGSTGEFWHPRVSDLPPRMDRFVPHLERKVAIISALVGELPADGAR